MFNYDNEKFVEKIIFQNFLANIEGKKSKKNRLYELLEPIT
jgi:hypothetical protein